MHDIRNDSSVIIKQATNVQLSSPLLTTLYKLRSSYKKAKKTISKLQMFRSTSEICTKHQKKS